MTDRRRSLEIPYRVRFDEAGANGTIHASVLLAWAQDAAWVHSTSLGFGREWYAERGLTWLVRAAELDIAKRPMYGDRVLVTTEIAGFRRILARRVTTFRASGGEQLARSLTDWVLLDGRGRPTRLPAEFAELVDVPSFDPIVVPRPPGTAATASVPIVVRARDVDPMAHANNAAYVGYVDEALAAASGSPLELSRYRLAYVRPARPGSRLQTTVEGVGNGEWSIEIRDDEAVVLDAAVAGRSRH